ncbi:hypothetical protein M378DRAFT_79300 [Amanita muscaria Koide BX008]|uniref:Extracellular metalloproteinase n=1 Tax=Amanita muscaria (strain Koide BX008) TaxID=946122 RepID=A0A0C2X388_AMAMK|nr:hypothetical protein M378DRAFT_79300 [Amanita muscaria Koide BX008]
MKSLFIASLVVSGIFASSTHGFQSRESGVIRRRKTLGFGPEHPHKVFKATLPPQIQLFASVAPPDPFEAAARYIRDITGNKDFHIRQDSYTDKNTGVTHVYARQVVNGLEVLDGDLNLNIKDGTLLSFGNSFYPGPAPAFFEDADPEDISYPHSEYCETLISEMDSFPGHSDQVVMGRHGDAHLDHLYHSNCRFYNLPDQLFNKGFTFGADPADFRPALLHFMIAATPKPDLADDIQVNFDNHMNSMRVTDTSHFAPTESHVEFTADNVPDAVNPVKVRLAYIQVPNTEKTASTLKLVWKFEVEMQDNWYQAAVSANAPHRIISVVDWASDSPIPTPEHPTPSYYVFPWGTNDPECGPMSIVDANADKLASPVGWHALPCANDPASDPGCRSALGAQFRNTTTTWGNNVFAQENWEGMNHYVTNLRPSAEGMNFHYEYDPKSGPGVDPLSEAKAYINATVTQLFYTSNMVHDIYYRYGFDEVSGNFQQYNFGRGGRGDDAVVANAQDGSGFNNANFMTPPDGTSGRMRMYLWNTALPYRDGDLEAGIVIHELSHGLSTRLTGGPADSGCLGWGESGGMGEGWGDFLATMIRSSDGDTEFPMGAWAANRTKGIRNYVYSTDNTTNPSVYKTLDKPGYWGVHAIGEVWAEMLWVVAQDLIKVHGFSDSLYPPLPLEDGTVPDGDFFRPGLMVPKKGNTLIVQLVISAMKHQPCRPTFFDARDAILQADQVLTGGENYCTIYKAFAKRGLGIDAKIEGQTPWGGGRRTNVCCSSCL